MPNQAELAEVLRHPERLDRLFARCGEVSVVDRAKAEHVAPYLAWARPDVSSLSGIRRMAVLEEAVNHAEMVRVCDTLAARGFRPLVLKGGAWAYSAYPVPWSRPRMDLDLLIAGDTRDRAFEEMRALGYARAGRLPGHFANYQEVFDREIAGGLSFTVDLHWQVSNRALFWQRLPAEAVIARARPAPFAGRAACQADPVDSVVLACLHPVAHHSHEAVLMWWHDIKRLASGLGPVDAALLAERSAALGVASIVAHGLAEARRWCLDPWQPAGPALDPEFIDGLRVVGWRERSRSFLQPGRGLLADFWSDVTALTSWRDRARLVREHVLPPAAFMLASYETSHRWTLPALYVHRLVGGGARWMWSWLASRVTRRD